LFSIFEGILALTQVRGEARRGRTSVGEHVKTSPDTAGPRELDQIRAEIEAATGVDELLELLTMYLGPDHLIVAARVSLAGEISADDVEDLADQIDQRLADVLPQTPHVFIDPTQTAPEANLPATS
jgi:divalent metal cation (Fe/Co/Zn/Cd) transporter